MTIESLLVSSIMTKDVKTAGENQIRRAAAEKMDKADIGSIVIVGNTGIPSGIITKRDIVKIVSSPDASFEQPLSTVMKTPVITGDVMMSLKDALQTMQTKGIRRLPIMENGKMVGIVTDKDIFRAILKSLPMVTSLIDQNLPVDYRPVYQRLSEFMVGEINSHPSSR